MFRYDAAWFYHPGRQIIKSFTTAMGMPVASCDYTTVFVGNTMQTALVSFGEAGGEYFETWVFTFDSTYRWTLYNETEQGRTRAMGGDFVRRDAPAPRHR